MRAILSVSLMLLVWGSWGIAYSQPQTQCVGIAVTDGVETNSLPAHLRTEHARFIGNLYHHAQLLFDHLGRFDAVRWSAVPDGRAFAYEGTGSVDFVVHLIVRKHHKIYRNEVRHYLPSDRVPLSGAEKPYEILSRPVIVGRLEVRLVEQERNKTIWSAMRDSTAIVPHSQNEFIYNPSKHPGWTHPAMIQGFLADIVHLQALNRSVERILNVSVRWFISRPRDDLATARGMLAGLITSVSAELDANLPLEGRIKAMLPEAEGRKRVVLDIGARDGLTVRLRLDVWRPLPAQQKVGQIEIVGVDSTTSIAWIRKIEKKFRKRGEGPEPGDRVISRKRSASFRSNSS